MKQLKLFSLFLLVNLFSSTMAFAGASITVVYQPLNIAGVPTLGGSMLIVLALLLAAVAFRMLKQYQSGTAMLLGVLGVTALMSGAGGVKLLSDAYAGGSPLSIPAGGSITVEIDSPETPRVFSNTSGIAQHIVGVSTTNTQFCSDIHTNFNLISGNPHCTIGSTVQPTASCYVVCSVVPNT